jgi:hypothetical protein
MRLTVRRPEINKSSYILRYSVLKPENEFKFKKFLLNVEVEFHTLDILSTIFVLRRYYQVIFGYDSEQRTTLRVRSDTDSVIDSVSMSTSIKKYECNNK